MDEDVKIKEQKEETLMILNPSSESKKSEEKKYINPHEKVQLIDGKKGENEEKSGEDEEELIRQRKEKIMKFIKSHAIIPLIVILTVLIILGVYIRIQPMLDHNGRPGLWDITTNDYTLGPDLDPFLFLRYAKTIILTGELPRMDMMRYVPLGFDTTTELQMVSYMIVLTYKLVNLFGDYSINFAGVFMPVIFFALTILSFFFFVREIFIRRKEKESIWKANFIASLATLFMIIMPGFLSRTVAGIPEKESVGFFFMFLAFFLYLRAWKCEKMLNAGIVGVLAGIATALMGLTWGGVTYIYTTIALATLAAFFIGKISRKEGMIYGLWLILALIITMSFTNRFSLMGFITSLDTGLATFVLAVIIVDLLLRNEKIKNALKIGKIKLPEPIISAIVTIILGILTVSVVLGPSFIIEKVRALNQMFFNPVQGRWVTTVAENRQPYYVEWVDELGTSLKGVPIMFWLFFAGSILMFKKMLKKLGKKDSWILTGFFVLFLMGIVFSRYAPHPALLDGENLISKAIYYLSGLLLIGSLAYYQFKNYKNEEKNLKNLDYEYIFAFSLLVLALFTARSAIRLVMVLTIIAPIFYSYLFIDIAYKAKEKDKKQIIMIVLVLLIGILLLFSAIKMYNSIKTQAYYHAPYYYTYQWQKAMEWVRNNTAENAVFAHWWDYGYWVQSIGNRATVTDGGNAIVWWNYLTGRYVLTGDNEKQSLEFLWNHNATHLLIDSSDIGKYGAFSQIGSDENFDRLSHGPITLISESRNIQETQKGLLRIYNMPSRNGQISLFPIEEDIVYNNGTKINLFKESTGLASIKLRYREENNTITFEQPEAIFYSQGQQVSVPLKYLYYNNEIIEFSKGINATIYPIQRVIETSQGLQVDPMGAMIYISPRVLRGFLGQVYILNDAFNNFPHFKLVHTEPDFIIDSFNQQNAKLRDFVYYHGIKGPIKIWEINYTGEEKVNEEYLLRSPPDYITWKF